MKAGEDRPGRSPAALRRARLAPARRDGLAGEIGAEHALELARLGERESRRAYASGRRGAGAGAAGRAVDRAGGQRMVCLTSPVVVGAR